MFFKKKKTEVDDDFDDIDNFDDFDLDEGGFNDATQQTGPRKVISDIKGGFIKGLKDNLLDPTTHRKVLKETMPEGYVAHYDDARTLLKETRLLYNTALKEGTKVHKEYARELAPSVDKWNETKDSKMSRALARAVKVRETDSGLDHNDVSDEELSLQQHQAAVFGNDMAQQTAEGVNELSTNAQTNAGLQRGLTEKSNELLTGVNNAINQTNAFNEQVALKWKKTTLEIQFRQYFTARKQLEIQKQNHEYLQATLPSIVKNTSLPDAVKIQTTELAMQSFNQKIFGNLTDKATASFGDFAAKFAGNLKESGMNFAEQMAGYSPMLATALGMFNNDSGFGTTPQQMAAEFVGGMLSTELTNYAINKSKNKLSDLAGSERLDLEHKGNKVQFFKDNMPSIIDNLSQNGTGVEFLDKLLKWGGADMLVSSRNDILQKNTEDKLQEVALFTLETQRSITTTIPGLLSEIHGELKSIRGGWDFEPPNPKDNLRMDWSTGQLNTTQNIQRRISNELYGKARQDAVSNITYDMLESLGFDREQLNTHGNILDDKGNEILSRRDVNYLSIAIKTISYQTKDRLDLQEFAIGSPYITDERARFNVAKFFTEHLEVEDHGVDIKGAYDIVEAQNRLANAMSSQEFKVSKAMSEARRKHHDAGIDEDKWQRLASAGYGDIFNKMGVTGRDEKGNLIYDAQADMERLFKDQLVKVTDPNRLWRDDINNKFGAQDRANRGHNERKVKADKDKKEAEAKEEARKAREKARHEGDRKGLRGMFEDGKDKIKDTRQKFNENKERLEELRDKVLGGDPVPDAQNPPVVEDIPIEDTYQPVDAKDAIRNMASKFAGKAKMSAEAQLDSLLTQSKDLLEALPGTADKLRHLSKDDAIAYIQQLIKDTQPEYIPEPKQEHVPEVPIVGPVSFAEGVPFAATKKPSNNLYALIANRRAENKAAYEAAIQKQLSEQQWFPAYEMDFERQQWQPVVDETLKQVAQGLSRRYDYTQGMRNMAAHARNQRPDLNDDDANFYHGGTVTSKTGLFRNFKQGGPVAVNQEQRSYIQRVSDKLLKQYVKQNSIQDNPPWYQRGVLSSAVTDRTAKQSQDLIASLKQAIDKEASMGGKPQVIVASEGEEVLSTDNGDAAFFRKLRQSGMWDRLKTEQPNPATEQPPSGDISEQLKKLREEYNLLAAEAKDSLAFRAQLLKRDITDALGEGVSRKAAAVKERGSNALASGKQWFSERDFELKGMKLPALTLQQKPLSVISHQMAELIRLSGHVAINTGSESSDIQAPNPEALTPFQAGSVDIKGKMSRTGGWFKNRFKRQAKNDAEHSEERRASIWSKITARFERAKDRGEEMSDEDVEAVKAEVQEVLDDPKVDAKQKKSLLRRVAGLPWGAVKLGTKASWGMTKFSAKASWFMGSGTAKAGWWGTRKVATTLFGSKGGSRDVYLIGQDDPIILARDLKAGKYLSIADGKPVLTTDDIKGPLIDEQGNMPFTMQDFTENRVVVRTTEGTRSLFVKGMLLTGRGIKGGLGLGFNMTRWSTKLAWNIAKLPFSIATMKMDKKIETDNPETILKDIYVKGGGEPRIQAALVDKPAYFNAKKEPVTKYNQLNEPVYDINGNLVISSLDIKKGLVTPDGVLITKVLKGIGYGAGAVIKTGWRTGVALTKLSGRLLAGSFKMVTGAGRGLWNMLRGRGLFDGTGNSDYYEMMIQAQAASVDKLEMIRIILDERLEEKKKKFNDKDGDGHRDGSFLSQLRKKKEDADKKKDKPKKEKGEDKQGMLSSLAGAVTSGMTAFFSRGALMALLGGLIATKFGPQIAGGIFGGIRSVLPEWLGGYSAEKKAQIKEAGGSFAHVMRGGLMPDEQQRAQARGDGSGDGSHFDENGFPIAGGPNHEGSFGMSTTTKFALGAAALYLGPGRLAKGVGAGAKGIGKGVQWLSNKTGLTGRLGVSGMGKWAATKHLARGAGSLALRGSTAALRALPLLTSTPVGWAVLGVAAAALAVYGGYKLYKYLKNRNNHLATWRMAQYGFKIGDSKVVTKILDLEEYLGKHTNEARKNAPATLSEQADPKEAMRIMGISEKDEEAREKFFHWFFYRFKPVFLSWKTLANTIARQTELHKLDDRLLKAEKIELVDRVNFLRQDQNPYDMMVSPIAGKDMVSYDHEAVIVMFKKVNKSLNAINEETHDMEARKAGGGRGKLDLEDSNLSINKMSKKDRNAKVAGGQVEREERREQIRSQKQEMKALIRGEKVNNRNLMDNIFGNNSAGKSGGGMDWSNPFSIGHSAGNMFKDAMSDLMKYLKGDRQPVSSLGDQGGDGAAPGDGGPSGTFDASSKTIKLTPQDVEDLAKVTSTEVIHSLPDAEYHKQAGAVVDTIINRVAAGGYGNSIRAVINAKNQFSAINGPPGTALYGKVENMPWSKVNKRLQTFIPNYLAARANGGTPVVASELNYLNPVYSSKRSMDAWGKAVVAQATQSGLVFGVGKGRHYHGTDPTALKKRPFGHRISLNGKISPPTGKAGASSSTPPAAAAPAASTTPKAPKASSTTTTTPPKKNEVSKEEKDVQRRLEATRNQRLRLEKENSERLNLKNAKSTDARSNPINKKGTSSSGILGTVNRDNLNKGQYTLPEIKDRSIDKRMRELDKINAANQAKIDKLKKEEGELTKKLGAIAKRQREAVPVATAKESTQRVLINAGNPNPNLLGAVDESKLRDAAKGTPWMSVAENQIGITATGNPQVVLDYHKAAGVSGGVGTSWCGSFVSWCFAKAGIHQFKSGLAFDWAKFGKQLSKDNIPYGAILVFKWDSGQGHVAFCKEDKGKQVVMLGGNQGARYNGKPTRGVTASTVSKSCLIAVRFPENYSTNGLQGDGSNTATLENAQGQKFQMNFDAIERIKKKQEERAKKKVGKYVEKDITLGDRGATRAKLEAAGTAAKGLDAAVQKAAKEFNKDPFKVIAKLGKRKVVPFETHDPNTYTGANKENPNAPIMEGMSVSEEQKLIRAHYEKLRLEEIHAKIERQEPLTKEEQVLLAEQIKAQAQAVASDSDLQKAALETYESIENDVTGKTFGITETRKIVAKDGKVHLMQRDPKTGEWRMVKDQVATLPTKSPFETLTEEQRVMSDTEIKQMEAQLKAHAESLNKTLGGEVKASTEKLVSNSQQQQEISEAQAKVRHEEEMKSAQVIQEKAEQANKEQQARQETLRLAEVEAQRKRAEEQERQEIQALNDSEVYKRQLEVQITMAKDLRQMLALMQDKPLAQPPSTEALKTSEPTPPKPPVLQTYQNTTVHKREPVSMRIK